MEIQEIERLAALLKPSGTIERGDTKNIEQRGPGIALRSQMQGADIIKQSLELPGLSLTLNSANDTIEILLGGNPPTPDERSEALRNAAHFLRHIQSRDQLSQNLLRKIEAHLATLIDDDQERTIMGTGQLDLNAIRAGVQNNSDSTIVSATPQYAMMERTTIESFAPKDLEQKRHLPLPMWSLIALAALFVIVTVVIVVIVL